MQSTYIQPICACQVAIPDALVEQVQSLKELIKARKCPYRVQPPFVVRDTELGATWSDRRLEQQESLPRSPPTRDPHSRRSGDRLRLVRSGVLQPASSLIIPR